MATKRDYYEVLGIGRNASPDEVKSAYKRLAVKFHPDNNPGDPEAEERFKEVTEAYEVLSDPEKRRIYDQFGHAGLAGAGVGAGAGGFGGGFRTVDLDEARRIFDEIFGGLGDLGFGSIFDDVFGTRTTRATSRAGNHLLYELEVTLEEAARGAEKSISVRRLSQCPDCRGSGSARGDGGISVCPQCGGTGQVAFRQGFFTVRQTCSRCGGLGEVVTSPCRRCGGEGRVREVRRLSVKVPPGVRDGTRLRLAGEGEAGLRGGPPGDLLVVIHVKPHPRFRREGDDIYCEVDIGYTTAVLGGEVRVPTLEGDVTAKVPPGSQSGRMLRLRGKGMPRLHGTGRGDEYVVLRIKVPTRVSPRMRRLLEELAALEEKEGV